MNNVEQASLPAALPLPAGLRLGHLCRRLRLGKMPCKRASRPRRLPRRPRPGRGAPGPRIRRKSA
eukprot:6157412-Alexandrium_andersonii.AAC.1